MIVLRHKWKKHINRDRRRRTWCKEEGDDFRHEPTDVKECVRCGLLRGYVRTMGFFPRLVYFRDHQIHSVDRIPYTCTPILKELNEDFLSINDFKLD